jgi:hypothetical protein
MLKLITRNPALKSWRNSQGRLKNTRPWKRKSKAHVDSRLTKLKKSTTPADGGNSKLTDASSPSPRCPSIP